MKRTYEIHLEIRGEDGDRLVVRYDNRGEPYRKGVSVTLMEGMFSAAASVFLEDREAIELRDALLKAYPL